MENQQFGFFFVVCSFNTLKSRARSTLLLIQFIQKHFPHHEESSMKIRYEETKKTVNLKAKNRLFESRAWFDFEMIELKVG